MYEPQEDSYLLQAFVRRFAFGRVLDLCTGSGIQARTAAARKRVKKVIAADQYAKPAFTTKKIRFIKSNLFHNITGTFDTIICNPPYLPQQGKKRHTSLEGGRKGWEVLKKVIEQAGAHLVPNGQVLIVFSSLTNKPFIDELIYQQGFMIAQQKQESHFFEKLYCYQLVRPSWRKELSRCGVKNFQHFMKGKRGRVFIGQYKKKKVAIKVAHEKAKTKTLATEAKYLQKANTKNVGPEYIRKGQDFVMYKYVQGKLFKECQPTKRIIINILHQARKLDQLGFSKGELHRPFKNIIVARKPVLIDFERSKQDNHPKNVTQFCSYLQNRHNLDLRAVCKAYKKNMDDAHYKKILDKVNVEMGG